MTDLPEQAVHAGTLALFDEEQLVTDKSCAALCARAVLEAALPALTEAGWMPPEESVEIDCPRCYGQGQNRDDRIDMAFAEPFGQVIECKVCGGSGRLRVLRNSANPL
jgi:hypothetical protein